MMTLSESETRVATCHQVALCHAMCHHVAPRPPRGHPIGDSCDVRRDTRWQKKRTIAYRDGSYDQPINRGVNPSHSSQQTSYTLSLSNTPSHYFVLRAIEPTLVSRTINQMLYSINHKPTIRWRTWRPKDGPTLPRSTCQRETKISVPRYTCRRRCWSRKTQETKRRRSAAQDFRIL